MLKICFRLLFVFLCVASPWRSCWGQEVHHSMDLTKPVQWGSGERPFVPDTLEVVKQTEKTEKTEKKEKKEEAEKWRLHEKGDATYYSPRTHGRLMASGERYDKNGLFCAHKTLPFGTRIRVVNKKNGREVVVVVKDRGPFAEGRVIDLSNRAAEQLGMLSVGVVPVELWVVEDGRLKMED